jgi:hypothetical protein
VSGIAQLAEHLVSEFRQDALADALVLQLAATAVGKQDSLGLGRHRSHHFLRPYLNHAAQGPLGADHAGANRLIDGASRGEQRAFNWLDQAAQDLAAPASAILLARLILQAESPNASNLVASQGACSYIFRSRQKPSGFKHSATICWAAALPSRSGNL